MSSYVMRSAKSDDFDAIMELARLSGPGFTSLPVDQDLVERRLEESRLAFSQELENKSHAQYLLVMEDVGSAEVVGCSAVKSGVGLDRPFFNFRVITLAQASYAAERRYDMDTLVLTNEFDGSTEVGTLFIKKKARGGGNGRLAARSRYMLMAASPERFGSTVVSELRGVVSHDGQSAFWNSVIAPFFRMRFTEADYLSAVTDNQFILDLMPKSPIYVELLPKEVKDVIGKTHPDGVGARKLLEWEGFKYARAIDIFDGGPLMTARREDIRTIKESRLLTIEMGEVGADSPIALISTDSYENYRVVQARGTFVDGKHLVVQRETIDLLQLKPDDTVRVWIEN